MANYFADMVAQTPTGSYDPNYKRPGAASHARLRKKRMEISLDAALQNDTIVFGTFKSSDRIYDLRLSCQTTAATGALNLGLYKVDRFNPDHVPIAANLIDVDLFASAVGVTTAIARTDVLTEAGTVLSYYRGKPLHYMAPLGGGGVVGWLTEDPQLEFDIVGTFSTALADSQAFMLEADYVSFG